MSRSRSQALRTHLGLTSALLSAATRRLLQCPDLAALLPSHLILLHQITRASVPLMKVAWEAARRDDKDNMCRALADYFAQHVEEERNHDAWTLEDLASIGIDRDEILRLTPSVNVASLVGAQYYWVLHHHPIALLGYIAMLEGNAPSAELIDDLQAQTGLPQSMFRTLRLHAAVDPDHLRALHALFDELPLEDRHENLIAVSAAHTGASFAYCLADLRPWMKSQGKPSSM
jgi:hypothetical protein